MDLAFLLRAERMLAYRQPARLDHSMLCAALAAQRAADSAGSVQGPVGRTSSPKDDPLTELLLAGPGWREALVDQGGCFSRAEAGRRINGS
jgi:hypothetical protein